MSRRTVLVTGANGFVGLHLCKWLLEAGYDVVAQTRNASSDKLNALSRIYSGLRIYRIEEINQSTDWSGVLNEVDYIVHLAAVAHRRGKVNDSVYDEVNTQGTIKLVKDAAASSSVKRLIFISTIGVHGNGATQVVNEVSPINPQTAYAKSKYRAECFIQEYLKDKPLDWCIMRPTLIYGAGNPGNMQRLFDLVAKRIPLPFASINSRRTFLCIDNLADAITRALGHPKASRSVFCMADSEIVTLNELLSQIALVLQIPLRNYKIPLGCLKMLGMAGDALAFATRKPVPFDTYSVDRMIGSLVVDNTKVRNTMEWTPPVTFPRGLQQVGKCYLKHE
ncbi:MAG: NAD-dependent epimerase/dehydratase family protein [Verrucomicrobiota bacterium]|nr:NAD-dependent epimerase/dehydratase family protein [Verrucomicrobiota bacterium]